MVIDFGSFAEDGNKAKYHQKLPYYYSKGLQQKTTPQDKYRDYYNNRPTPRQPSRRDDVEEYINFDDKHFAIEPDYSGSYENERDS